MPLDPRSNLGSSVLQEPLQHEPPQPLLPLLHDALEQDPLLQVPLLPGFCRWYSACAFASRYISSACAVSVPVSLFSPAVAVGATEAACAVSVSVRLSPCHQLIKLVPGPAHPVSNPVNTIAEFIQAILDIRVPMTFAPICGEWLPSEPRGRSRRHPISQSTPFDAILASSWSLHLGQLCEPVLPARHRPDRSGR